MCGIAGILRYDQQPIDPARINAMIARLRTRGPDGSGVHAADHCTLGHTRLAILDLADGTQPMTDGDLTVVFNGEIYNHRDLRRELIALGHRFHTDHSDTEVLLHGYRQWGDQLPSHLQGMFAFAIWDAAAQRLFLARDHVGKKPLYIWDRRSEFRFASTPAALLAGRTAGEPLPPLDPDAYLTFLRFGYTFDFTLLSGILELPPGAALTLNADGKTSLILPTRRASGPAEMDLAATLRSAVVARLEADVPLACFLSGGIDSSLVAAFAQRALQERGQRLRTFSVAMPHSDYDESPYARQVAEHLGTDHHELTAEPGADLFSDLDELIAVSGEPTADSSILPMLWLSRATRKHVKVALSGDGGDELFGGYDRYRALRLLTRHGWWLRKTPTGLLQSSNPRGTRTRLRRLADAARSLTPAEQYQSMIHLFTPAQIGQMEGVARLPASNSPWPPVPDWPSEADPVRAAMTWDLDHYLPMDMLRKVDRGSMAVGLEVRCPLLDRTVYDWARRQPLATLMPHGRPKGLLRQLAATLLPPTIARRPKCGFAVPIGPWFAGSLHGPLTQRLQTGDLQDLGVPKKMVETLLSEHRTRVQDHTHRLFALLQLSTWRRWLKTQ